MAITRQAGTIYKLAADAKPTASLEQAGITLQNTDDRKKWVNSGTDWIPQELPVYKKYRVFKEGSTTYVTDINGRIMQSNTDTQIAVQAQIDTMGTEIVYDFVWDSALYTMNNPILLPSGAQGSTRLVRFYGSNFHPWRMTGGGCTRLDASSSFPTNRYFIEGNNPGSTSVLGCHVVVDGFQVSNLNNFATRNVGFIKLENGNLVNGGHTTVIKNIFSEYLWRCIHLVGGIWFSNFEDILSYNGNGTFVGDNVLLLEDGGHTGSINPTPKVNDFNRFVTLHADVGQMNEFLRIKSGGYNTFRNFFVDGVGYKTAPLNLDNTDTLTTHNNTFKNIQAIDLTVTPSPDNRQACLYLAGTSVQDNVFRELRLPNYPIALKISGTGVKDNDIEMAAYFGGAASINDTGASPTNIIRLFPGNNTTGTDVPITHTGGVSKIIDNRRGANHGGWIFFTSSLGQTVFNIPHGLFAAPQRAMVRDASNDAKGSFTFTVDATNIIITYPFGVRNTGASNIKFYWEAGVYP